MKNLFALFVLCFLTGCAIIPSITDFSPKAGLLGTVIEIKGAGFNPDPYQNEVLIGGQVSRVISRNTTSLRVVALDNMQTGQIEVKISPTIHIVRKALTLNEIQQP